MTHPHFDKVFSKIGWHSARRWVALLVLALAACGGGGGQFDEPAPALALADLGSFGPARTAAETGLRIREQLARLDATKIFGKAAVDAFLAETDRVLTLAYDQTKAGAGEARRSALALSNKRVLATGSCETTPVTYEKDGFKYEGSMTLCPNEQDDKFVLKYEYVAGMNDLGGTKKGLRFELAVDAEAPKCPSSEGTLSGSTLVHYRLYVSDGVSATDLVADPQLNLTANVNDDADVEKVKLASNIGMSVIEPGFPAFSYNGVSTATGTELTLTDGSYVEQIFNSMSPAPVALNPKTVGTAMGMGIGMMLGGMEKVAQDAEKNWKTNGKCVKVNVTPNSFKLAAGEKKQVEAEVILVKDESKQQAKLKATADCGKSITPTAAHYEAGTPEKFDYTAPDNGDPGCFTIEATSKAGKDSKKIDVDSPLTVHIDSTITLTSPDGLLTGHITSDIPVEGTNGVLSGSAPISYDMFQMKIDGGCTYETGHSATDARVASFTADYDNPASTSMVLLPFHTVESLTAYCPGADPLPFPGAEFFFSGIFATMHADELSSAGWTMTDWTQGTSTGVVFVKRYNRTRDIDRGTVIETTVIELHASKRKQ